MIFNVSAGEVKTLPIVSDKYPEDITVKAGENAVFSAVIDKDGIPTEYTYKWYVNNSLVSDATTAVHTKKTDTDNGVYSVYCVITNKAGSVKTRTATLTVNALPKIDTSSVTNASFNLGDSKTYTVNITEQGYPQEYTYQWYLNGSKISGATSPSYTFKPTTAGTYTLYCEITNSAGTYATSKATITVKNFLKLIPGSNVFANKVTTGGFKEVYQSGDAYHIYIERTGGVAVPIDVTGFNTMQIYGEYGYAKVDTYTGLFSGSPEYKNCIVGFHNTTRNGEYFDKTYDISSVKGVQYFGMACTLKDAEKPSFHANLFSVVFRE